MSKIYENGKIYFCTLCNCTMKTKYKFERHCVSKTHKKCLEKCDDVIDVITEYYICNHCNYTTTSEYNYNRHILTKKHIEQITHQKTIHQCECGKSYKYQSGLSKHKNKCDFIKSDNDEISDTIIENHDLLFDMFKSLISQNNEVITQMNKQFESVMELAKEPKTITYNTNNTNTTNTTNDNRTQTFNTLNYLNNECKDAMNFVDMIKQMTFTESDLMEMVDIGWLQSTMKKFTLELNDKAQNLRPFHCTDRKRKMFFVKHNDLWEKFVGERLLQLVLDIYKHVQINRMKMWKNANLQKIKDDDDIHDLFMKMIIEISSSSTDKNGPGIKKKLINYFTQFVIDKKQVFYQIKNE